MKASYKNMKMFILIASLISLTIYSCKENEDSKLPEPELHSPSKLPFDTLTKITKEPFIVLDDPGLEAFLVIDGYDKDNAVNGKISVEDAKMIGKLSLNDNHVNFIREQKYLYFGKKYGLLDSTNKSKPTIYVRSIADFHKFPNLQNIYSNSLIGSNFDFSGIPQLMELSLYDLKSGTRIMADQNLRWLYIINSQYLTTEPNSIDYSIDLSGVKNATNLILFGISDLQTPKRYSNITFNYSGMVQSRLNTLISHLYNLGDSSNNKIDLRDLPNLRHIDLPPLSNLNLVITNCPQISNINFSKVDSLNSILINQLPNLKDLDLARFYGIYSLSSTNNSKLTTIYLNSLQKLGPTGNYQKWEKDPWTVWEIVEP